MLYREMSKEELHRVAEIDRREVIEYAYYLQNNKLELKKVDWIVPEWSDSQKSKYHQYLLEVHQRGGFILGAFDDTIIAGIVALDIEFFGRTMEHLNLSGLWVSQPYRNQGVGKQLVNLVKQKAKTLGAKFLYVSATKSKKTVEFYMSCECQLAKVIDPRLFELEPEDIHMECEL
ncbi:MAG: GNAT family N-acetyltransferase [Candidatus Thorarchaeota archaeon]|jgi:predicted N-acetyltransferase YhbS